MVKLLSSGSKFFAGDLFQSRLSRQIAAWVFFSIVTIEGVVFVPSYLRRQTEELHRLETVSQEVLTTVKAEIMGDMPAQDLLSRIQLAENSLIKGVAIYSAADGQRLNSIGEVPSLDAAALTVPASRPFWHFSLTTDEMTRAAIVRRSSDGTRYDVAWPSQNTPYILSIRHDATLVQRSMRRYVVGVAFLVVIISAFVTLVTLLVLRRIVIGPLLLLRDDLSVVGESISQSSPPIFASLKMIRRNELGEVAIAFQEMYKRIHQEIRERQEAEADLRLEQAKADRLLLNILPAAIAARLKDNETNQGAIANRFETATILFADIVKFTE
ncbi:MAG: adenylate/guanylate cyclase domain-containing protein, partial [Cyanobacteria bacterium J06560_2]